MKLPFVSQTFDKDGSGKISAAELKEVMGSLGQTMTDDEVGEMLTQADKNNDSMIDFEEFKAMMNPGE